MQLMPCFWLLSLLSVLVPGVVRSAPALYDTAEFKGIIYRQDDSDKKAGNPYIDESVFVYEGIWLYRKQLDNKRALQGKFTGDLVTAASYDDAKDNAEVVSGATGYNPGRFEIRLGLIHQEFDWGISGSIGYGQEFAYRSRQIQFGFNKSLFEFNTEVTGSYQYFDDAIRNIRFDGRNDGVAERKTHGINFNVRQSLSPISQMDVGWTHTQQSGLLATSYNAVRVNGSFEPESVPDHRRRNAVSSRYKRAFGSDSGQLGYSHYWDDWGLRANVFDLRYWAKLKDGKTQFKPIYRYYQQQAVDFFALDFVQTQRYQSSDTDLGDFNGQLLGAEFSFLRAGWLIKNNSWYDIGFHYYQHSEGLDFYWLTIGWRQFN